MKNHIIIFILATMLSFATKVGLAHEGIVVKDTDHNNTILIKRNIPSVCAKLPITNQTLWSEHYAQHTVPSACKSSYVHTIGKLLPMFLHEEIDTYGELEVLAFIKQMQHNKNMLLIDGRKKSWYTYRTIPGAINIPFHYIKEHEAFEFEYEEALKTLGVRKYERRPLDFRYVKDIVVFCNGPWCSQSVAMIKALLEIGYPADKINWYRGGIQAWLNAGLTSTRP